MNFSQLMRPTTLIILLVVLILLFGAKRLPDAARSLGRSMRILKAETQGLVNDGKNDRNEDLDEKADAQAMRQPLPKETRDEAMTGEVVDPPQRTTDR